MNEILSYARGKYQPKLTRFCDWTFTIVCDRFIVFHCYNRVIINHSQSVLVYRLVTTRASFIDVHYAVLE